VDGPVSAKITPILMGSLPTDSSKKKKDPKPMAKTIIPIIPRIDFFFSSNPNTRFIQQIILKDNLKLFFGKDEN
jgi:hypothetical protein